MTGYRVKGIGYRVLIIVLLCTMNYALCTVSHAQQVYLGYKLSFYNVFSPSFEAFRRTHQFRLGYQSSVSDFPAMNIEAQYNWIDDVSWKNASHNLTAWVLSAKGIFTDADEAAVEMIYFIDLINKSENRLSVNLNYTRTGLFTQDFYGKARVGIGVSKWKFLPIYGLAASYAPSSNSLVNLRLNWLEYAEDNSALLFKLPISAGIEGKFASQGGYGSASIAGDGSGLEYTYDPLRSYLPSSSESKISNYWLKGYMGDKLFF